MKWTNAAISSCILTCYCCSSTTTSGFLLPLDGRKNAVLKSYRNGGIPIHDSSVEGLERKRLNYGIRPHQQLFMTTSSDSKNDDNNNNDMEDNKEEESSPPPIPNEEKLTKNVKRRLAQANLDAILNSPDPPFDRSAAIASLQQNDISTPIPPDSPEHATEQKLHKLESSLYESIQSKDYESASQTFQTLNKMHLDDCGFVLQTNSAFYKAFSTKDYNAMEELWLHDPSVLCIHPSQPPLVGAHNVLESWKQLFSSSNSNFQQNKMEPTNIRLSVKGTTAIVTCDEEVSTRRFRRGKKRKTEVVNKLIATNVFRKMGEKWFMVHHHASWHADTDAAKNALNPPSSSSSSSPLLQSSGGGNGALIVRKKLGNGGASLNSGPNLSMDGVLGIPGNDLGGSSNKDLLRGLGGLGGGEDGPQVKRVFMGSLSDLLNGGLSDILSGSMDDDVGDGEDRIIRAGSGNGERTIIHLNGQIDDEEEDEEDDDEIDDEEDDEDDDDDDNDDLDDKEEETQNALKVIKDMAKMNGSNNNDSNDKKLIVVKKKEEEKEEKNDSGNVPKDNLRQNCITALRKLCEQGSISQKQKRILLTDIITCSAKGEFSMVEVAFELLCGEGEDKDAAEEEFADQCRVFATALPEFPVSR